MGRPSLEYNAIKIAFEAHAQINEDYDSRNNNQPRTTLRVETWCLHR